MVRVLISALRYLGRLKDHSTQEWTSLISTLIIYFGEILEKDMFTVWEFQQWVLVYQPQEFLLLFHLAVTVYLRKV